MTIWYKATIFLYLLFLVRDHQIKNEVEYTDPIKYINLFSSDLTEGVSCYRIPAIITAPNGDIITSIDERVPSCGDLKWNEDINIVMRRSHDNGETWSGVKTIVDYPVGESASDPSFIVDEVTGTIFLFYNYMNLKSDKDVYYLKFVKSEDNGLSWSAPMDITAQITKPGWKSDFKFITSGRGIQQRNGTLIHTLVNLENGIHLFNSTDHGKTWALIDVPIIPGDESKVIELADGSLMVNSRVNKAGTRYVHRSVDNGRSWETKIDSQLIDPGCNASIIHYTAVHNGDDKNRLLFTNASSKNKRENLTIRISYDEGKSWSKGKTIYAGSAAYSSMTILNNGEIGVFFEKDDYTQNVFVRLTLEWLTDGKDKIVKAGND